MAAAGAVKGAVIGADAGVIVEEATGDGDELAFDTGDPFCDLIRDEFLRFSFRAMRALRRAAAALRIRFSVLVSK